MDSGAIGRVRFDNPQRPEFPVEVLSFGALRRKAPKGALSRPMRPAFHQLAFVTSGAFDYEIDFVRHTLSAGTVAWLEPGQVQRLDLPASTEGWLLMFTAEVPTASALQSANALPPRIVLGAHHDDALWLLHRVRRLAEAGEDAFVLLQHLLGALLLVLRRAAHTAGDSHLATANPTFALFRAEVERRFAHTRRLADYERRVGYCSKTLTRATMLATGQTAKQYIDQRVALEAQRLLAHGDDTVTSIAARLGFSETTNFVKFFSREVGVAPSAFRSRFRAVAREPARGRA